MPTAKDTRIIRQFEGMDNLAVAYGDITDYDTVLACVTSADYVLHPGGPGVIIRRRPRRTVPQGQRRRSENIIQAVKSQPDPDAVRVVTIGTVAQSGDRSPPHHWGLVGDPLRVSHYDEYSQSKVIAERELIDYGLKNFVSLHRQVYSAPASLRSGTRS